VEEAVRGDSDQVRELKQLQEQNGRLKKLVPEVSLDKAILQMLPQKSGPARAYSEGNCSVARNSRSVASGRNTSGEDQTEQIQ
jgi:hypothetical protein